MLESADELDAADVLNPELLHAGLGALGALSPATRGVLPPTAVAAVPAPPPWDAAFSRGVLPSIADRDALSPAALDSFAGSLAAGNGGAPSAAGDPTRSRVSLLPCYVLFRSSHARPG